MYKRLVIIAVPFGFHRHYWRPDQEGVNYGCEYSPLYQEVRDDVTILSNVSHGGWVGHGSTASFLSGILPRHADKHANKNETLDQFIGRHVAPHCRYPSLSFGATGRGEQVSWTREGVLVPEITSIKKAYNLLFVPDSPASIRAKRKNLEEQRLQLEIMAQGAASISSILSSRDRLKLQEYRESIRNLGRDIAQKEQWIDTPKRPPKGGLASLSPKRPSEAFAAYLDLTYWTLMQDLTRMVTVTVSRGMNIREFGGRNYHSHTHHGQLPEKVKVISAIDRMVITQTTAFIKRLRETPDPEGSGSMLDNTMVLLGSGMEDGNSHSCRNIPIMLAGGGFKHGSHKRLSGKERGPDLLFTLARQFGLRIDRFNRSQRELTDLA